MKNGHAKIQGRPIIKCKRRGGLLWGGREIRGQDKVYKVKQANKSSLYNIFRLRKVSCFQVSQQQDKDVVEAQHQHEECFFCMSSSGVLISGHF